MVWVSVLGAGLLLGLGILIPAPRLEIGPSGIAQIVLWRTTRLAWPDVHEFRPSRGLVGFDYTSPPPKGMALRRLNAAVAGVEGALQPGWEMGPQALADLLNQARAHWLAAAAGSGASGFGTQPPATGGALN